MAAAERLREGADMTSSATPTTTCAVRAAAGAGLELCPRDTCGLWDEHGCLVETLRIPLRTDLAEHLLELRLARESARDAGAVRAFR